MSTTESYDIVIIGAGPVGLVLSVFLARWGYKIKHIDNRAEPTTTGRADGIQPRSLDMLKNMGLKRHFMAQNPARVYEVAFWDPQGAGKGIHRTGTWASCPKFIDSRHPYTTLLHQGYIERIFITDLEQHGTYVQRPWTITGFRQHDGDEVYPVEVDITNVSTKESETVRAKYLFSGEGARSFVREQLGIKIHHKDPIAHVWGVMDGIVQTNFPDIKVAAVPWSSSIPVLTFSDEVYDSLGSRLDHDHTTRKQLGPTLHSTRFVYGRRLGPSEEGFRCRGSGVCEKNTRALLDQMGEGGMVLNLPNRSRHFREVYPR